MQAVISEQSLGLTSLFVGQLASSYTDLVLEIGIGLLVLSGVSATESTAEREDDQPAPEESETVAATPVTSGDS